MSLAIQMPSLARLDGETERLWIKGRRMRLGLLQREAAAMLGVAKSSWKAWEHGRNRVAKRYWWRLTNLLGQPPKRR